LIWDGASLPSFIKFSHGIGIRTSFVQMASPPITRISEHITGCTDDWALQISHFLASGCPIRLALIECCNIRGSDIFCPAEGGTKDDNIVANSTCILTAHGPIVQLYLSASRGNVSDTCLPCLIQVRVLLRQVGIDLDAWFVKELRRLGKLFCCRFGQRQAPPSAACILSKAGLGSPVRHTPQKCEFYGWISPPPPEQQTGLRARFLLRIFGLF
jgi:hypothetical protein